MTDQRPTLSKAQVAKLAAYAEKRGLTLDELADRLGNEVGLLPAGQVPSPRRKTTIPNAGR